MNARRIIEILDDNYANFKTNFKDFDVDEMFDYSPVILNVMLLHTTAVNVIEAGIDIEFEQAISKVFEEELCRDKFYDLAMGVISMSMEISGETVTDFSADSMIELLFHVVNVLEESQED